MPASGQRPLPPPVFILCPPRSFSSVICAMLGQHPDLYGFPELNLFLGDTVDELLLLPAGLMSGLLRALAQVHEGRQTAGTVAAARDWLEARRDWPVRDLFDHLRREVAPRAAIDKSPLTALFPAALARADAGYPDARFLHVTRHPATALPSLRGHVAMAPGGGRTRKPGSREARAALVWCASHTRILTFTQALPPARTLLLRGEDLLADPAGVMPRLAEWLGVDRSAAALAAAHHPEASPYAHPGPRNARLGNDPHFQAAPTLVPPPLPTDLGRVADWAMDDRLAQVLHALASELGYVTDGPAPPPPMKKAGHATRPAFS
ncbi:MAG: sulfotransferase [Azospirillaceae bacterium]|nr:sulfotransferase [Azospirillaceae bacterium]